MTLLTLLTLLLLTSSGSSSTGRMNEEALTLVQNCEPSGTNFLDLGKLCIRDEGEDVVEDLMLNASISAINVKCGSSKILPETEIA